MSEVALTNIAKTYDGTPVIGGVSLNIVRGEFLTVLGPSGCGKSTLLRIVAGLDRDYSGSVAIGGKRVDHLRPKHRDLAMVFQSYALYPHLTAAENIAVPLVMRRLSWWQRLPIVNLISPSIRSKRAAIDRDVRDVAKNLEILSLLDRKPGQLSGGQRQRVALARAMVRHPAVFLMDEPLSNLDSKLRVQMRAEIAQLHRRVGATFIYVTHDQAEAMTMSDRVAIMIDGQLLQVAPPQVVYSNPSHINVARFIGSPRINIIAATVRDHDAIDIPGVRLTVKTNKPVGTELLVGLRPEWLTLTVRPTVGSLAGRVQLVEHLGADLFVHIDVPGHPESVIIRAAPHQFAELDIGQVVHVTVQTDRIVVFEKSGERVPAAQVCSTLASA